MLLSCAPKEGTILKGSDNTLDLLAPSSGGTSSMVKVEGGWFPMGSNEGEVNERPKHAVYVEPFAIDRYEVSAAQFAEFLNSTGNPYDLYFSSDARSTLVGMSAKSGSEAEDYSSPEYYQPRASHEDYPANFVSWHGASEFCKWKGKRLPSEAEWEKAARSDDERAYPWGNEAPAPSRATIGRSWDTQGFGVMTPVDSNPDGSSPYGAQNMSGNVWEWVEDFYRVNFCDICSSSASDPGSPQPDNPLVRTNPRGPATGQYKVLRGGSWFDDNSEYVSRTTYRYWFRPMDRYVHTGFRCAADKPVEDPAYEVSRVVHDKPVPTMTPPAARAIVSAISPMGPMDFEIYFDFDKSNLRDLSRSVLDEVSDKLAGDIDIQILVEGHCDERGTNEYNIALGDRRATSAREYLLAAGIPSKRIQTISYGEEMPGCTVQTEECWQLNRRDRLMLLKGIPAGSIPVIAATGSVSKPGVKFIPPEVVASGPSGSAQAAPAPVAEETVAQLVEVTSPKDITQFRGVADVTFGWKPVANAVNYKVIVSSDKAQKDIIEDLTVPGTSYVSSFLNYGTYFYTINAYGPKEGQLLASSRAMSFIVAPPVSIGLEKN